MDISFLTNLPQFQQLSEDKKNFLIQFAGQDHGNTSRDVAQSLMQAVALAKNNNISFSKDESTLLIQVLKQGMSKEDAEKTDRMLQMMQQFMLMQQLQKF